MTSSNDTRNPKRSIVEDSFEKELREKARERLQERENALHGTQQAALHHNNKTGAEGPRHLSGKRPSFPAGLFWACSLPHSSLSFLQSLSP